MYLSRAFLNPRHPDVIRDLADPYRVHQRVMESFPRVERATREARALQGLLHRLDDEPREGRLILWIQSPGYPRWGKFPRGYLIDLLGELENPATRPLETGYPVGSVLSFRLRANPRPDTWVTFDGSAAPARAQNRWDAHPCDVEVVHRPSTELAYAEPIPWLRAHGSRSGFALCGAQGGGLDVDVTQERALVGYRPNPIGEPSRLVFASVLYEGRLLVTDEALFRDALCRGIGHGKAFGFGLVSVLSVH